jgi:hypothetical protein
VNAFVLGFAVLVFAGSVFCAAILLPSQIEMYYTPTDRPDVVFERWQYLILTVVVAVVLAVGFGSMAEAFASIIKAFYTEDPTAGSDVALWVGAWVFVWSAGTVWLVIWLGNGDPRTRPWFELLLGSVGVTGVAAITVIRARIETRGAQAGPGSVR